MGLCRFQKYLYILEIQITLLFGNLSRLGPVCQHEHRAQYVTFQNIQGKRNNYKVTQMQKKNICCIYCFQQNPRTIKTYHNRSDNPQKFIKSVRNLHRSLTFPESKKSFISLPAYDKSTENGDLTIRRLCLDKTSTTI